MTFPLATLDPAITYTNKKKNAYQRMTITIQPSGFRYKRMFPPDAAAPAVHCGCASEDKRSLI
jgi:hypothetical protein